MPSLIVTCAIFPTLSGTYVKESSFLWKSSTGTLTFSNFQWDWTNNSTQERVAFSKKIFTPTFDSLIWFHSSNLYTIVCTFVETTTSVENLVASRKLNVLLNSMSLLETTGEPNNPRFSFFNSTQFFTPSNWTQNTPDENDIYKYDDTTADSENTLASNKIGDGIEVKNGIVAT